MSRQRYIPSPYKEVDGHTGGFKRKTGRKLKSRGDGVSTNELVRASQALRRLTGEKKQNSVSRYFHAG